MDEESKRRIREAVEGYTRKHSRPVAKKNAKPEEAVGKDCDKWFLDNGWFMARYESKAKFIKGIWRASGVSVGTPDRLGCTPHGVFAAVELKAPGRLSTLSDGQRDFLVHVIKRGGFGVVVDSVARLAEIYATWQTRDNGRFYLAQQLPRKRNSKESVGALEPSF